MKFFRGILISVLQRHRGNVETINSQSIRVYEKDENNNVSYCSGTVTITDAGSGYAKGCIYIKTDVGAGSTGIYENVGTTTSCNFDLLGAGAAGPTTLLGLTDTPGTFEAQANKIVKVNNGETAVEFVTISGDVAMSAAGIITVTDLTMAGEAQGDILYFDGTNWVVLAAGTNGYVLKTQGAGANPTWIDPSTLPISLSSKLTQTYAIEAGANDITHSVTSQTVGGVTLTIPDFASVADTYVFVTLAQTLLNKILTAPDINGGTADALTSLGIRSTGAAFDLKMAITEAIGATRTITWTVNDTSRAIDLGGDLTFAGAFTTAGAFATTLTMTGATSITLPETGTLATLAGAETLTNKTIVSFLQGPGNTLTMPAAADTLVGKATTDVFTNKSIDADGTGNVITNINADELDPVADPTTGNASDTVYGVPVTLAVFISNQAAAVNIYNANAPFKFKVLKAWSVSTSADGGTWKLNNGAAGAGTDITNAVTVAASADDFDEPTDYTNSAATIASGGSLSVVPDGGGALDCYIYIEILRLA